MKKLMLSLMAVAMLGLVSVSAVAQDKNLKERITFSKTTWVNGTSVDAGSYLVRYDAKTGDMTISNGKEVIVTAKATIQMHDKSANSDTLLTATTPAGMKLTGIRFGGQREEIKITDMAVEMGKDGPTANQ